MAWLKSLHLITALLSIAGFVLRGFWMMLESPRLQAKAARIVPPIVDTLLLLSGIGLVVVLHYSVGSSPWLITKIIALVAYIVLGIIALKRGRTKGVRISAFVAAVLVFGYIAAVAVTKSPWLGLS
jgi:uncharacterized membrane protein SirB2